MTRRAKASAWADPESEEVRNLIRRSERIGWRRAVRELDETAPFFVERMENLALGNWQVLTGFSESPRVLDIGCGFGSITLGSSSFARCAIGVDVLSERVSFGSLRAKQSGLDNVVFVEANGLGAPFAAGSFDIVTLNGVLEWAGLYASGDPVDLQRRMLEEAARLTSSDGSVCVAIENSVAAETLLGLKDTHTGIHFLTALPEPLSSTLLTIRKGEDPRVRLHTRRGYRELFRDAGLSSVRVLSLVPSYNNYRFVVLSADIDSHRFLYTNLDSGAFYGPADRLRRFLARTVPSALPHLTYSYLIVGQRQPHPTFLEPDFPVWRTLGVSCDLARFGVQMTQPGAGGIFLHQDEKPHSFLKFWPGGMREPSVPPLVSRQLGLEVYESTRQEYGGLELMLYSLEP